MMTVAVLQHQWLSLCTQESARLLVHALQSGQRGAGISNAQGSDNKLHSYDK